MIALNTRFDIFRGDVKKFFKDFMGTKGAYGVVHKDLCTISSNGFLYIEITKFTPEGTHVTKRYRHPETLGEFLEQLRDSNITFKLKKQV